jgi:protein-S-isoprenylcysteine O-methyltransferase Ste14
MKKLFIPPVFVLLSFILIVMFYFLLPEFNLIKFPFNLCGLIIALIGFGITGKTNDLFKKYKTTLYIEKSSNMITEGVFSKTRNPMYIGMFLVLLGSGIAFMNIISLLIPFGFILLIRLAFITKEEKMMHDTFGQDYLDYKNRVRRWI